MRMFMLCVWNLYLFILVQCLGIPSGVMYQFTDKVLCMTWADIVLNGLDLNPLIIIV